MPRYMLDTNLCICVLRDRPAYVRERFIAEAANLCTSTIVMMELLTGVQKSNRPWETGRAVTRLTAAVEILDFDSDAAEHSAEIRGALERKGQVIGPYDLLIAGHARSRGLIVVSGNMREFLWVDGLRSEDWLSAG